MSGGGGDVVASVVRVKRLFRNLPNTVTNPKIGGSGYLVAPDFTVNPFFLKNFSTVEAAF